MRALISAIVRNSPSVYIHMFVREIIGMFRTRNCEAQNEERLDCYGGFVVPCSILLTTSTSCARR